MVKTRIYLWQTTEGMPDMNTVFVDAELPAMPCIGHHVWLTEEHENIIEQKIRELQNPNVYNYYINVLPGRSSDYIRPDDIDYINLEEVSRVVYIVMIPNNDTVHIWLSHLDPNEAK